MKKTQYGWAFFVIIIIIAAFVVLLTGNLGSIIIISGLSLVLLLLFYKLTIEVTEQYVQFSMGVGLISGKYQMSDVQNCKPLNYTPFGWGVRWRPGVTLFNVSGNKAIELEIKNKSRKIWIGTDDPEEIASFINSKRANTFT